MSFRILLSFGAAFLISGLQAAEEPALAAAKHKPADLVAVLTSSAPQKEKADACRELARIGGKESVAALAGLLTDESLSHMARYALETMDDPGVNQALRDAAPKLHGRLLAGVIGSLGVRHDTKAVPMLSKYLADSDLDVSQAAARALGKIASADAAKALLATLKSAPETQQLAVCEGLLRCAEQLQAKGSSTKAAAICDEIRSLSISPHQVRTAALRGSIIYRGADGASLLGETLRSPDYPVFATGARVSHELPGGQVTQLLASELGRASGMDNGAGDRQTLLIQTLAKRHDQEALPALITASKQGDAGVRIAAIRALGELATPAAVPELIVLLKDSEKAIAQEAQETLASLPGSEVDAAVMRMLNSDDTRTHVAGIELAARRRMAAATPVLLRNTDAADPLVRAAAMKRLGELASISDLSSLLELLNRAKSPELIEASEQALAAVCTTQPGKVADRLTNALATAAAPQKVALIHVLTMVGGAQALKVVRASVDSTIPEVRAAAIRALSSWPTVDAAPSLLEIARTSNDATERMISLRGYLSFASHGDLPDEKRLAMCREVAGIISKPEERKLLLSALGGIASVESLTMIAPCLGEATIQGEAGTAIVSVCEKLLERQDAATFAAKLMPPLEKVASTSTNEELRNKAKSLLARAREKSASK